MSLVVYTTIIGKTDNLKRPANQSRDIPYFCFTDRTDLRVRGHGWKLRKVARNGDPCKQSRRIKIMAHEMFPDADVTLWIDAAYQMHSDPLCLLDLLGNSDMVAMKHPHRNRITDEAQAVIKLGIIPPEPILAQLALYHAQGFDTDANPQQAITSTGFCIRRNNARVAEFERLWWEEVEAHTYRDQMSIDYVAQKVGLRIAYIPGHYRNNPYAKWYKEKK